MTQRADFVVLGGGPAGCTVATLLARKGHDVLIVDRNPEPLLSVGESLLPFCGRVLEQLAIPMDGFLRKDGAVFVRGGMSVRFDFSEAWRTPWDHAWQVPRDDFDRRFRVAASEAGVRFYFAKATGVSLPGTLLTDRGEFHGDWIIDAGGRNQFLATKLGIRQLHPTLRNAAFTRHYTSVVVFPPEQPGDITVCKFPGGWFWFIPFADGSSSVGMVMEPNSGLKGDRWSQALARCPDAEKRLVGAVELGERGGVSDFTAYAERFYGDGWALIGDASMFLDPVFSSGILFGLEAASRFVDALDTGDLAGWEAHLRESATVFEKAILAWYSDDFMDLALVAPETQKKRIRAGITSLLAGDAFEGGNPHALKASFAMSRLAAAARDAGLVPGVAPKA